MTAPVSALDAAAVLGVRFRPAVGTIEVRGSWLNIGSIIVGNDDMVRVVPRHRISAAAERCLLASATQAAIYGPERFGGVWRFRAELGWLVDVVVRRELLTAADHTAARLEGVSW
ncbi:hypothetical protein AB0B25_01990 [Nocardia sp. NPDC049190]|uniref:hypothetical protein n=1 Tax=Nocardia sp. NPDC049190 TaxID=3155650 RepID=UPI0033D71EAE